MADRRTRTNPEDRRRISERTSKSLTQQASPLNVYREQQRSIRRYADDFLLPLPSSIRYDEDEDDSAELLDAAESSRTAAASLYDALAPVQYENYVDFHGNLSRSIAGPSEPIVNRELVTSPRPVSPPPAASTLRARHSHNPSGSTLTRQPSLRRIGRARTMDFNDWATRRRTAMRQQAADAETTSVRAENSNDGTWRFASLVDRSSSSRTSSPSSGYRIHPLPLTAWSDPHLRIDASGQQWGFPDPAGEEPQASTSSRDGQSSSQLWFSLTGRSSALSPNTGSEPPEDSTAAQRPPRLRRGSLRDTSFPRFVSPFTDRSTPQADGEATTPPGSRGPDLPLVPRNSEWDALDEASRQLLTPRSISPDGEVFRL